MPWANCSRGLAAKWLRESCWSASSNHSGCCSASVWRNSMAGKLEQWWREPSLFFPFRKLAPSSSIEVLGSNDIGVRHIFHYEPDRFELDPPGEYTNIAMNFETICSTWSQLPLIDLSRSRKLNARQAVGGNGPYPSLTTSTTPCWADRLRRLCKYVGDWVVCSCCFLRRFPRNHTSYRYGCITECFFRCVAVYSGLLLCLIWHPRLL